MEKYLKYKTLYLKAKYGGMYTNTIRQINNFMTNSTTSKQRRES